MNFHFLRQTWVRVLIGFIVSFLFLTLTFGWPPFSFQPFTWFKISYKLMLVILTCALAATIESPPVRRKK